MRKLMKTAISVGKIRFFHPFRAARATGVHVLVGSAVCLGLLLPASSGAQSGVGDPCSTNGDCATINCIDGTCCDLACSGTCRSCALIRTGQANGTCAQVLPGQQSTSGCNAADEACGSTGCVPAHCFNTIKDGDETDVDCGGSCPGCDVGKTCDTNGSCLVNNCIDGICCAPSCNQTCRSCALAKTGQPDGMCAPVLAGEQTTNGCSAAGQACSNAGCVPAHCFNTVKDGDETDVDCGGSCPGCGVASTCDTADDCSLGNCIDGICCNRACFGTCRSCALTKTGQADGTCAPVLPGQQSTSGCNAAGEACSSVASCVPTHCFNTMKDSDETDVDCGGTCPGCDVSHTCNAHSDCSANNCIDGICCDPSCSGTCHSCALAKTDVANGTCAQVLTGRQTTNGCNGPGDICDDSGSCVSPTATTAPPTATATLNASPTATDTAQPPTVTNVPTSPPTETPALTNTPTTPTQLPTTTDTPLSTPTGTSAPAPTETATAISTPTPTPTPIACVGDCDFGGTVTVDELVKGVNIALATASLDLCTSFDCNGNQHVTVDCLVKAVNNALNGCSATP